MDLAEILKTGVDFTKLRQVQRYAKAIEDADRAFEKRQGSHQAVRKSMIVKRAGSKTYDIVCKGAKLGPGDKDYKVM